MTTRVFISYRSSDGTDKATALARDLDALFGQSQVFLDKEDLPAGSRWRDEIARTLSDAPILLGLVTPNYRGAVDAAGKRCIDRADDPVRDELESAVAANAHIVPLMCDGVVQTPPESGLPAPFDQLSERTWRHLRAYDWREDLARLADDLRAMGLVDRDAPATPVTAPSSLVAAGAVEGGASTGRRLALAGLAAVALGAGFAAWRWQEGKGPNLAGKWRASVGKRGATSSRDGEVVMITFQQTGTSLKVASSAVDIERDPDWQNYRDFWQQSKGQPLNRVFYRGEGEIRAEGDEGPGADAPPGPRRIQLAVHVDAPEGGDPIDTGALRGAIDPDSNRIRGRLWLNSEQAERVVDLRREP
jgi:hypothetical protein